MPCMHIICTNCDKYQTFSCKSTMHFWILATVAVYQLYALCAAPTHHLRDAVDLKTQQLNVLNSQQRFVAKKSVHQPASGKHGVRQRSKRGAIVNGFTSWDYEPFDKMGGFRSGRERPSKREVVRSLMSATDHETVEEDVERDYNRLVRHPKATIAWVEPEILDSCWTQAMLGRRYTFVPSCNMDDTFTPKQCHKQRCWCVNSAGKPVKTDPSAKRFYYLADAIKLKCPTIDASDSTSSANTN